MEARHIIIMLLEESSVYAHTCYLPLYQCPNICNSSSSAGFSMFQIGNTTSTSGGSIRISIREDLISAWTYLSTRVNRCGLAAPARRSTICGMYQSISAKKIVTSCCVVPKTCTLLPLKFDMLINCGTHKIRELAGIMIIANSSIKCPLRWVLRVLKDDMLLAHHRLSGPLILNMFYILVMRAMSC